MLKVCTQKDFVSATLKRIRYVKAKLSEQKARYSFRISKFEFQEHRTRHLRQTFEPLLGGDTFNRPEHPSLENKESLDQNKCSMARVKTI